MLLQLPVLLTLCVLAAAAVLHFGEGVLRVVNGNVVLQAMFGAMLMQWFTTATSLSKALLVEHALAMVLTRVEVSQTDAPLMYAALRMYVTALQRGGATTRASTNLRILPWQERQALQRKAAGRRFAVRFLAVCTDSMPETCVFKNTRVFFTCTAASVTVSMFGRNCRDQLQTLVQDIASVHAPDRKGIADDRAATVDMYCVKRNPTSNRFHWERLANIRTRFLNSVALPGDMGAEMLADARLFFDSATMYDAKGQPHRRGYTFHGPPGCGKTTLAHVLASELDLPLCAVPLQAEGMTDGDFHALLRDAPVPAILLLEDLDALGGPTRSTRPAQIIRTTDIPSKPSPMCTLTLSGILNALDGISSQEGRLVIATTNELAEVDRALLRPSRCGDKILHLTAASPSQTTQMVATAFPDSSVDTDTLKTLLAVVKRFDVSPCKLQSYLAAMDSIDAALNPGNVITLAQGATLGLHMYTATYDELWSAGLEPVYWFVTLFKGIWLCQWETRTAAFEAMPYGNVGSVFTTFVAAFGETACLERASAIRALAERALAHTPWVGQARLHKFIEENGQSIDVCLKNADAELFGQCPAPSAGLPLLPLPDLLRDIGFENVPAVLESLRAGGITTSMDVGFVWASSVKCPVFDDVKARLICEDTKYISRSRIVTLLKRRFNDCSADDAWKAAYVMVPVGRFLYTFVTQRVFHAALFTETTPAAVAAAVVLA